MARASESQVTSEFDFDAAFPVLAALRPGAPKLVADCELAYARMENFAEACVEPRVLPLDRDLGHQPDLALDDLLRDASRHRIWSLAIPRSFGGEGLDALALSVGLERLAQDCAGIANLVAVHGLALAIVAASGNLALLAQLASRIVESEREGSAHLLATAATEPGVGSDLEDLELLSSAKFEGHAESTSSGWKLWAQKSFVSNGSLASGFVVIVPTDRTRPAESLSAFFVEAMTPGVSIVRVENKLGQRACPAAQVAFDGCHLPANACLTTQSLAGPRLDLVLGASRATVAAFGAGIAHGVARAVANDLSRIREAHPWRTSPATENQALARLFSNARQARSAYIDSVLANARLGLDSLLAHPILRRLDRMLPRGVPRLPSSHPLLQISALNGVLSARLSHWESRSIGVASAYGSQAKVVASEMAQANCELAIELLGPYALREESGYPKRLRDARLLSIYEGTNEICLLDVARRLTKKDWKVWT